MQEGHYGSVVDRTMLRYKFSLLINDDFVPQPLPAEVSLTDASKDASTKDLHIYALLQFMGELLLTTPSAAAIQDLFGVIFFPTRKKFWKRRRCPSRSAVGATISVTSMLLRKEEAVLQQGIHAKHCITARHALLRL
jgi:hypothetical protein